MRAAILTPAPDYWEPWTWAYDVEAEALKRGGIDVAPLPWTEADTLRGFDVVLPLVAWGYHFRFNQWLSLLDRMAGSSTPLMINAPELVRWNSDKAYLEELGRAGVPTVPSLTVNSLGEGELEDARKRFGPELVIKPLVSAAADDTYRIGPTDFVPASVRSRRMLVQPFMPSIADTGEYSLLIFGGKFSHALVKRPKQGDFRVQPHHGGSEVAVDPPAGAVELALSALAAAPAPATYARVDMIVDPDGALRVMELELIEPALWLQHAPDGGIAFAEAIKAAAGRA